MKGERLEEGSWLVFGVFALLLLAAGLLFVGLIWIGNGLLRGVCF